MSVIVEKQFRSIPKLGLVITSIDNFSPDERTKTELQVKKLFEQAVKDRLISEDSFMSERIFNPQDALTIADTLAEKCVDAILIANIAFPNGQVFLTIANHPRLKSIPLAVISDPEPSNKTWATNAWCGVIMNNHVAKAINRRIHVFPGPVGSSKFADEFNRFIRVSATIKDLSRDLLVRFGDAPSGFHSATPDQMAFARVFGTRMEMVDMTAVLECMRTKQAKGHLGTESFSDSEVDTLVKDVMTGRDVEVPRDMIEKSVRLYFAYRTIIRANGYTSAAMRCWPEQNESYIGFSSCMAMSLLLGRGDVTSASCESDCPMAVMQTLGALLTNKYALCLDWVNYTGGSNTIQLGHCGVGVCGGMECGSNCGGQREAVTLHPVNIQGGLEIGPVVVGQYAFGPKTGICINQDQNGEFAILAFEGENTPDSALGIKYSAADVVVKNPEKLSQLILDGGFSHHLAVARGHVADDIELLCKLLGVRYVNPDR